MLYQDNSIPQTVTHSRLTKLFYLIWATQVYFQTSNTNSHISQNISQAVSFHICPIMIGHTQVRQLGFKNNTFIFSSSFGTIQVINIEEDTLSI